MIRVIYWKQEKICALCDRMIPKHTAAMFDEHKSSEKQFVHLQCWTDLQEQRGIELETPPF